jgi:hypothetical protein
MRKAPILADPQATAFAHEQGQPDNLLNTLICWLIAECVTCNSLAAKVTLPNLEVASKLRRQVNGGNALM